MRVDVDDLEVVAARYIAAHKEQAEIIGCTQQWIERVRQLYGTPRAEAIEAGPIVDCEAQLTIRSEAKAKPAKAKRSAKANPKAKPKPKATPRGWRPPPPPTS